MGFCPGYLEMFVIRENSPVIFKRFCVADPFSNSKMLFFLTSDAF